MNTLPITFENKGKNYSGHFSKVMGACHTSTYHLADLKNFYLGRLRYSEFSNGWVFDATPKTPELKELADFFGIQPGRKFFYLLASAKYYKIGNRSVINRQ